MIEVQPWTEEDIPLDECDFEYLPGHLMLCTDWRMGLRQYT